MHFNDPLTTHASLFDQLMDDLVDKGFALHPSFISPAALETLISECDAHWHQGEFRHARVGVGDQKKLRPEIRTDRVLWIDESLESPTIKYYMQLIEQFRQTLNRSLFLGLHEYEGHFAVYPPGSFYAKHLDQFKGAKERIITCILYLNHSWKPEDGGQLRLYLNGEAPEPYLDIQPEAGTFICFRSDAIWHEVLPSHRDRYSITGWLRTPKV